jgi:FkbM family methyltransferase
MNKKLLIEVGACDGTDSLKFYKNNYRVYSFEPHNEFFKALQEKTKNMDDFIVVNKAVSLTDGTVKFNVCASGGASSLLSFKEDKELLKHWGSHRTDVLYSGTSYDVESTRLDTFIEENHLENKTIDYLHVDAQGLDLDVLKSLGKYISNVQEGVIETASSVEKAIYIGQTNVTTEATKWLEENNFSIQSIQRNDFTDCEYNIYFRRIQS